MGTDFESVHFNAVAMECDVHDVAKNDRKMKIWRSTGLLVCLIEHVYPQGLQTICCTREECAKTMDGSLWGKEYSPTYIPHTS